MALPPLEWGAVRLSRAAQGDNASPTGQATSFHTARSEKDFSAASLQKPQKRAIIQSRFIINCKTTSPQRRRNMDTLTEYTERSKKVNEAVASYIKQLFRQSAQTTGTEVEAALDEIDSWFGFVKYYCGALSESERNAIGSHTFPEWQGFAEDTYAQYDDGIEMMSCRFMQDEGINGVLEIARSMHSESMRVPCADVIVSNFPSATTLVFHAFVPEGFCVAPASVAQKLFNGKKKDAQGEPEELLLQDYPGSNAVPGQEGLCVSVESKLVTYANLQTKGGFFKLLHEIMHAWQIAYDPRLPGPEMKYLALHAMLFAHRSVSYEKSFYKGDIDAQQRESFLEALRFNFQKSGVTFDLEQCYSLTGQPPGSVKIGICDERISYCFTCSDPATLLDLMDRFEWSERSAWAYALNVIRFLRAQGIDIEPELKTLSDFQSIYEPALQSYQSNCADRIFFPGRPWKFMKRGEK